MHYWGPRDGIGEHWSFHMAYIQLSSLRSRKGYKSVPPARKVSKAMQIYNDMIRALLSVSRMALHSDKNAEIYWMSSTLEVAHLFVRQLRVKRNMAAERSFNPGLTNRPLELEHFVINKPRAWYRTPIWLHAPKILFYQPTPALS